MRKRQLFIPKQMISGYINPLVQKQNKMLYLCAWNLELLTHKERTS